MSVTRSQTIDSLLTLTADAYYKSGLVHDGVFKSNPTFAAFKAKGIKQDGGNQIQVNLMYGQNDTVNSYSRYGTIANDPQELFEPAYFSWAQYAGTVNIDGLSEAQNSGKPAIQKKLREETKNLIMSFSERMNKDLWDATFTVASATTGNGGLNINSIPLLIQAVPTDASTVGGIQQSTKAYWRNQTTNSGLETTPTFSEYAQELRHLWNLCSQGYGGSPDVLVANLDAYEAYETGMDFKVRYSMDDTASVGFEAIKFKTAKMYWDAHVPDPTTPHNWDNSSYSGSTQGAVYMLNTKNIELVTMPGKDFAPLGFQRPANQDARTGMWVFYGQVIANNRRKLGVLHDITTAAMAYGS